MLVPLIEANNIHGYNEDVSLSLKNRKGISVVDFKTPNNEGYIISLGDFWLVAAGSVGVSYSWYRSSDQSVRVALVRRVDGNIEMTPSIVSQLLAGNDLASFELTELTGHMLIEKASTVGYSVLIDASSEFEISRNEYFITTLREREEFLQAKRLEEIPGELRPAQIKGKMISVDVFGGW